MSDTRIINIRSGECFDENGKWRDGYVYIGRYNKTWKMQESVWANPHKLADYKDNPQEVLDKFQELTELKLTGDSKGFWLKRLSELDGKTLVCWCVDEKGNGLCHGKVLIELIEKYCR